MPTIEPEHSAEVEDEYLKACEGSYRCNNSTYVAPDCIFELDSPNSNIVYHCITFKDTQPKISFIPRVLKLARRLGCKLTVLLDHSEDWDDLERTADAGNLVLEDVTLNVTIKAEKVDPTKHSVLTWLLSEEGDYMQALLRLDAWRNDGCAPDGDVFEGFMDLYDLTVLEIDTAALKGSKVNVLLIDVGARIPQPARNKVEGDASVIASEGNMEVGVWGVGPRTATFLLVDMALRAGRHHASSRDTAGAGDTKELDSPPSSPPSSSLTSLSVASKSASSMHVHTNSTEYLPVPPIDERFRDILPGTEFHDDPALIPALRLLDLPSPVPTTRSDNDEGGMLSPPAPPSEASLLTSEAAQAHEKYREKLLELKARAKSRLQERLEAKRRGSPKGSERASGAGVGDVADGRGTAASSSYSDAKGAGYKGDDSDSKSTSAYMGSDEAQTRESQRSRLQRRLELRRGEDKQAPSPMPSIAHAAPTDDNDNDDSNVGKPKRKCVLPSARATLEALQQACPDLAPALRPSLTQFVFVKEVLERQAASCAK